MTWWRSWLSLALVLMLSGCYASLEGPPVDLRDLAKPDPLVHGPQKPLPTPPPGPTPTSGYFRAYVPRQTAVNGDTTDGHWITVSTSPPAAETAEPALTIPRAPRASPKPKPTTLQVPVNHLPPNLVPRDFQPPAMPASPLSSPSMPPPAYQPPIYQSPRRSWEPTDSGGMRE